MQFQQYVIGKFCLRRLKVGPKFFIPAAQFRFILYFQMFDCAAWSWTQDLAVQFQRDIHRFVRNIACGRLQLDLRSLFRHSKLDLNFACRVTAIWKVGPKKTKLHQKAGGGNRASKVRLGLFESPLMLQNHVKSDRQSGSHHTKETLTPPSSLSEKAGLNQTNQLISWT